MMETTIVKTAEHIDSVELFDDFRALKSSLPFNCLYLTQFLTDFGQIFYSKSYDQVCKYAFMLICIYMQVCKYLRIWKYGSMQLCTYMQVGKYASMQVCKYASIEVCKYGSMRVCKYASPC